MAVDRLNRHEGLHARKKLEAHWLSLDGCACVAEPDFHQLGSELRFTGFVVIGQHPQPSAGAYGMVMSSNYNTRGRCAEILVDGDQAFEVRRRETIAELYAGESLLPE